MRWPGVLVVGLLLVAGCDEDEGGQRSEVGPGGGADAAPGRSGEPLPIAESDPDLLATYEPWERECIGWIRTACHKQISCEVRAPSRDCWLEDARLRGVCKELVDRNSCMVADPASFQRCRDNTTAETCDEYCSSDFCVDTCYFICLD
jgi:hypothetical protein